MILLKQFSTNVFNGNLLFWFLDGKLRNKSWIELIKAYWELWRKDEYSWTVKQSKTSSVARNLLHTAAKIDNSVRKYNFHYFKLSRFSKIKVITSIFYSTKKSKILRFRTKIGCLHQCVYFLMLESSLTRHTIGKYKLQCCKAKTSSFIIIRWSKTAFEEEYKLTHSTMT